VSWARDVYLVGRGQARNLRQVLRGRPIAPTSFESMTLDADDVEIARRWLGERSRWRDVEVVESYGRAFAEWNGCERAFPFASGRESLSACIEALGLRAGDEAIVPAYTCVVVPNAFAYGGIEVVWADIELETYGLDVADVARRLTARTKALLLPHHYGLVSRDYEALLELALEHDIKVIEDCAHATGAELRGRKVGLRGDVAFYSSEHSKVFNTIMGGVAIARDPEVAEALARIAAAAGFPEDETVEGRLRQLVSEYYRYKAPGRWWRGEIARDQRHDFPPQLTPEEKRGERPASYGRRLPAPLAEVGTNQLDKLDRYNERRRRTARKWDEWCAARGYERPLVIPDSKPVYLRYPVMVEPGVKRDRSWGYRQVGTATGGWFHTHTHPVPSHLSGFPCADEAVARCINLPCLLEEE